MDERIADNFLGENVKPEKKLLSEISAKCRGIC
jgi:hypothetical protein